MVPTSAGKSKDPLGILGTIVAEKYQILGLAGEGGFSLVYQARHLIWQQLVAIKFFIVLEDAEPNVRERLLDDFIREGKLMSELSSRSSAIVQARDIGKLQRDSGWIPYMVLEWLDGRPLDGVLALERRENRLARSLPEAMQLLEPVAAALDLAHRRNVAHRDLKPANVMLMNGDDGASTGCKVLDFGIAKVMGEQIEHQEQLQLTGHQITAFTPNYGAPEQFSRQYGATGPWTDVFAMALILVEILRGGVRALDGQSFFELGVASSHPVRPTPHCFGLEVSAEVEAVFARALAIAPAERYATMGEFWLALHREVFPGTEAWRRRAEGDNASPASSDRAPIPSITARSIPAHLQPNGRTLDATATSAPTLATFAAPNPPPTKTASALALALGGVAVGGVTVFLAVRPTTNGAPQTNPSASAHASAAAPPMASASTSALAAPQSDGPCPHGMKIVNGATFTMGSSDKASPLWQPAHKVTLGTFCLDANEVTVREYRACVERGACKPADTKPSYPRSESESDATHAQVLEAMSELCNANAPVRDEHPINCVDWQRAEAYCAAQRGRLPTEAEWELAARGTDGRRLPWGDDAGDHTYQNAAGSEWRAWLAQKGLPKPTALAYEKDDGHVGSAPIGRFPRAQTPGGQLDMIGNVWEWTHDWFGVYGPEDQANPKGPGAGDRKVIRGGGFSGEFATAVTAATRALALATASSPAIGFRCAADVKPAR